jgi:hypothetical protein
VCAGAIDRTEAALSLQVRSPAYLISRTKILTFSIGRVASNFTWAAASASSRVDAIRKPTLYHYVVVLSGFPKLSAHGGLTPQTKALNPLSSSGSLAAALGLAQYI